MEEPHDDTYHQNLLSYPFIGECKLTLYINNWNLISESSMASIEIRLAIFDTTHISDMQYPVDFV